MYVAECYALMLCDVLPRRPASSVLCPLSSYLFSFVSSSASTALLPPCPVLLPCLLALRSHFPAHLTLSSSLVSPPRVISSFLSPSPRPVFSIYARLTLFSPLFSSPWPIFSLFSPRPSPLAPCSHLSSIRSLHPILTSFLFAMAYIFFLFSSASPRALSCTLGSPYPHLFSLRHGLYFLSFLLGLAPCSQLYAFTLSASLVTFSLPGSTCCGPLLAPCSFLLPAWCSPFCKLASSSCAPASSSPCHTIA
jgi:hypothetical protein